MPEDYLETTYVIYGLRGRSINYVNNLSDSSEQKQGSILCARYYSVFIWT